MDRGGGLDRGITENMWVKVEYDYLDFGTKTYTYNLASAGIGPIVDAGFDAVSDPHAYGGLNYRFTWGGGRM